MRRVAYIAVFGLLLTVPLWAQHGGGHAGGFGGHAGGFSGAHMGGGGGHAGFSGSSGVHSSGVHSFSGMRSAPSFSRSFTAPRAFSRPGFSRPGFSRPGFSRPNTTLRAFNGRGPFLHDRFRDRDRFRDFRLRDRPFFNNCWGWNCWAGYPWGYDSWLWNDDSSYDQSYDQNLAEAAEMNRDNLEEQQMLRQEEADGDQDAYAQPMPARPRASEAEAHAAAIQPTTVLIFRDQHKQEVENYAIVGRTLWNFAPQRTQKIPLSDLDLAATTKANDDRGVTFRVPAANENPAPPANMQGQPPAPTTPSSSSV
jgi:hypothetical protein